MTGYNFTDRVRRCLQLAREEADRLRHGEVRPEHILLGILDDDNGVGVHALVHLGADLGALRKGIVGRMPPGNADASGPDRPYTRRAKQVLEDAMREARDLGHAYVGTEHLLLGTASDEQGSCAVELAAQDVTLDVLRAEILRLVGSPEIQPGSKGDLLARAAKLVRRLKGDPPPDAREVKRIAIELETIIDQLRE